MSSSNEGGSGSEYSLESDEESSQCSPVFYDALFVSNAPPCPMPTPPTPSLFSPFASQPGAPEACDSPPYRMPTPSIVDDSDPCGISSDPAPPIANDLEPAEPILLDDGVLDYTPCFTTNRVFSSRDEVLAWARSIAVSYNFALVTHNSCNKSEYLARVNLVCDRFGKGRGIKSKIGDLLPMSGTRKCGCTFQLQCAEVPGGGWSLAVWSAIHVNHTPYEHISGSPYATRPTPAQQEHIKTLTESHVKPKQIQESLKKAFSGTIPSIEQIRAFRNKLKAKEKCEMNVMQFMLSKLNEHNYFVRLRRMDDSAVLRDIVFAHVDSIRLSKAYPFVLEMDTTYKTNKYKMPMFEVIGFTSTWLNFSACVAFMTAERENNYTWVLRQVKSLLTVDPDLIITDNETALIKAIQTVFPNTTHMLCREHMRRNVVARVLKAIDKNAKSRYAVANAFWGEVRQILDSTTEDGFSKTLSEMENKWGNKWGLVPYVRETWLDPFKERLCLAWLNNVFHVGHLTTNRVESAHSMLKRFLATNRGDIEAVWSHFHSVWGLQFIKIAETLGKSKTRLPQVFSVGTLFSQLRWKVSKKAVELILAEYKKTSYPEFDPDGCDCKLEIYLGIPCAHEMVKLEGRDLPIPLERIHRFWRTLKVDEILSETDPGVAGDDLKIHLRNFLETDFDSLTPQQKLRIRDIWKEVVGAANCDLEESPLVKGKGRGKKKSATHRDRTYLEHVQAEQKKNSSMKGSNSVGSCGRSRDRGKTSTITPESGPITTGSMSYVEGTSADQVPIQATGSIYSEALLPFMRPYMTGYVDVEADGHCGYRVVAEALGYGQASWALIRMHLARELRSYPSFWSTRLYFHTVESLLTKIEVDPFRGCGPYSWYNDPDCSLLVATIYQVAVVSWGGMNYTIMPLRRTDPSLSGSRTVINILHMGRGGGGEHYVALSLRENHPMPQIIPTWLRARDDSVVGWDSMYYNRIAYYQQLFSGAM